MECNDGMLVYLAMIQQHKLTCQLLLPPQHIQHSNITITHTANARHIQMMLQFPQQGKALNGCSCHQAASQVRSASSTSAGSCQTC